MEPAPLRNDLAEGPEGGGAVWVRTRDGVRLRAGGWPGGSAGTVLLFTGRTEYIEKYGRIARLLADWNLATATFDWRGQGLADRVAGDRNIGHVRRFEDYRLDVETFLKAVRSMEFPEPFHLLAHSMGGAIGLRALTEGLPVRSAVFSAPMWGINFPFWLRPFTGLILGSGQALGLGLAYAPGTGPKPYPFRQPFEGNRLTSDAESYEWLRAHIRAEPRFGLGGPSVIWLREAIRAARELQSIGEVPCPALTLFGSEEDTVDPVAIMRLGRSWANGTVETLPAARHEAMMETPEIRADFVRRSARHMLAC